VPDISIRTKANGQAGGDSDSIALQCELYNAALEERRGTWQRCQRSISYFDQAKELSSLKDVCPEVLAFGVTCCRGTLTRLDCAYDAFY
jgi:putative transposase